MKKNITFEYAMDKLNEIVKKLEDGNQSLDSYLKLYQQGVELAKYCEEILDDAEQKVTVLSNQYLDLE